MERYFTYEELKEIEEKEALENWKHYFTDRPICPYYVGGGDWGTDCELTYELCCGPDNDNCPISK